MKQKRVSVIWVLCIVMVLLLASSADASLSDWANQIRAGITGHATSQSVVVNVSVTTNAPTVTFVTVVTPRDPTENGVTGVSVNFTANDADGVGNINDTSALVNITYTTTGEGTRTNSTCSKIQSGGTNSNYSCIVNMWYFDIAGTWNVTASIMDASLSLGQNRSTNFTYNSLTAFVLSPASVSFASISPGATNTTSNNDPIILNNTGNYSVTLGNVQMNATNLVGEVTSTQAIYANNMTVGVTTGSNAECDLSATNQTIRMTKSNFASVTNSTLGRGNNSLNNGITGQEQLYVCILLAGNELSQQAYSTAGQGSWTVKIV